jgi:adenylate cyclase
MRSSRSRFHLRTTLWLYLCLIALSLAWLLLEQVGVLKPLQRLTVDARFRVRGTLPSPVKLIYVDIDNAAISQLGNFPWDRGIFAQVCDTLITHGGAKAVGIDVVFSSGGIPNIADLEKFHRGQAELGAYLFNEPPVVIAASYAGGFQIGPDGEARPRELPLVDFPGTRDRPEVPEWPMGPLTYTPSLVGLIDTVEGNTDRVYLYAPAEERNYYQLSLELARLHYGLKPEGIRVAEDHIDLVREDGELVRRIPMFERQKLDVNWFSPWLEEEGNPRRSIFDIYTLAQEARSENPAVRAAVTDWFSDGEFKDAIVLIGPVDPLLQDTAPTPFDRSPVPKVGVHGNLLKTIVSGRFLRYPPRWALPVITLGLTALVAGLSLASEGRRSAVLRLVAGGVLVGYVALCFAAFSWGDWVLPMVVPLGAALSSAFIGGAAQLVLAQKQKSRIKGLFGAYLAPAVVNQMVDSGQEPKLGGVEADITAYFSDVQSFSTFSEVLSPQQLVELMNEYLTACTDIVQAEGGTLDKYIGDAVVAMYGAPLALPSHAYHAAVAALRVERRCAELREKWRHEMPSKNWPEIVTRLRTRVGLNSGHAVVGNMGSATRFSYTMMGDTVNLAARMESGAKSWGVFTMCADPTRNACLKTNPERVVFRSLGRVVVKGRKAPVPIHELVGLKEDVDDRAREAVAIFEQGLAKYYAQDWEGAMERFQVSARLEPNQPDPLKGIGSNPSLIYQQLVRELRAASPGPGWDGAYVMRDK